MGGDCGLGNGTGAVSAALGDASVSDFTAGGRPEAIAFGKSDACAFPAARARANAYLAAAISFALEMLTLLCGGLSLATLSAGVGFVDDGARCEEGTGESTGIFQ